MTATRPEVQQAVVLVEQPVEGRQAVAVRALPGTLFTCSRCTGTTTPPAARTEASGSVVTGRRR
ncbi:hypothetical protein [Streptacidiphilus melanogenes]|uniref:hypothetical protein n=1 Tax=Streptacidiphilus melanogenes TaxID=411235 RepID=UPI0012699A05|nr:hypothetical protein [Streptacidiphilus melanogenes]